MKGVDVGRERGQDAVGPHLLPNLFTTAALFSGFYAVLSAVNGHYEAAAIAIFVAMVLDGMDGRVARMTNTQTAFGAEYDSLSDMVAFGLAPALVMYVWALKGLGKFGWLAAFIYTAAAALRLARFNTQVWSAVEYGIQKDDVDFLIGILTAVVGILMVSNIRYHSFKELDFRGKVPFFSLVVIMLVFAIILWQPPAIMFIVFLCYAVSGPVLTLTSLRQRRMERQKVTKSEPEE